MSRHRMGVAPKTENGPRSLTLKRAHLEILVHAAADAAPAECCGLLIGYGTDFVIVTDVIVAENVADEPDTFLINPQLQFDWLRKLRDSDRRIIGHFHSHPNGRCEPSQRDLDMAVDPEQVWLIVPVLDGVPGAPAAYIPDAKRTGFSQVAINLLE
jgi:proteasome lid subunit RPN8/RPN11